MKVIAFCSVVLALVTFTTAGYKTWKCESNQCIRGDTDNSESAVSIEECKVTCLEFGALWPAPEQVTLSQTLVPLNVHSILLSNTGGDAPELVMKAFTLFKTRLEEEAIAAHWRSEGRNLEVIATIKDASITSFVTNLDESFQLKITDFEVEGKIIAEIVAPNFFGFRHGLETLGQLIVHDDIRSQFKIISSAMVADKPAFTHRGISLDTARTFFSLDSLMRTIDGMSMNKMNTFHWHITDTHSFPFESKTHPQMTEFGAYSTAQVYSQEDIKNLVEFGRVRGIRVYPEFDQPAHVGEGWQAYPELVTCFRWLPWSTYCVEPPCGQFDPTNDQLYPILYDIYKEYHTLFDADIFHLGGDEVNINCWNSTERIVKYMQEHDIPLTTEGYHQLWNHFQTNALKQLRNVGHQGKVVLWSSSLTSPEHLSLYLNPNDYIIQTWELATDNSIAELIRQNFSVIFSNYNELYLDCGGPSWIGGPGQNWCSPYKGWQSIYRHDPIATVRNLGFEITDHIRSLILGSEAALWTEQIDDATVDYRLWPRAAALAERLWSNRAEDWTAAQYRMNHHRQRMAKRKIGAELLQPQWCLQNDGYCGAV